MRDKTKIPLPAVAADSGPFKILDSENGKNYCIYPSNKIDGVLSVPLGETPDHLAIRVHEYGHLLLISSGFYTPELPKIALNKNIDNSWFQMSLDVIVNSFLTRQGCDEIAELPLSIPNKNWGVPEIAMNFLRSAGLKVESKIKLRVSKIISEVDLKFLEKAAAKLNHYSLRAELPVKEFFSLLKELQKRFGKPRINDIKWGQLFLNEPYPEENYKLYSLENLPDTLDITPENEIKELLEATADKKQLKLTIAKLSGKQITDLIDLTYWNKWGEMKLADIPLLEAHPTRKNAKKIRSGFIGAFRYPHRALLPASDGMAFACRKKAKGGTILLDCSGSMRLNVKNLINLLNHAPMLTLACYAGDHNYKKGSLAIFIKDGIIAEMTSIKNWHDSISDGNVIDGPAIRWLIKQAKPRIWISDGIVTGIGDIGSDNLNLEIMVLKKIGRIKQYKTIRDCLKAFKNKVR